MEQTSSSKGLYWLAAIVITGLLMFLIFKNISTSSELDTAMGAITSLEQAKTKSDSLYKTFKAQLDIYKSENDNLYQQVSTKEEELKAQYEKISRMIDQARRDEGAKKQLESRLKELTQEIEQFQRFIKEQGKEMEALQKENAKLLAEKGKLADSLKTQVDENQDITNKNQTLTNVNSELNQKVELASVLKIVRVEAQAIKATVKGDDKGINFAKKTEKLKVCFDVVPNEVAPTASDAFYLRIIDPTSAVIIVESKGSGKMQELKNGKEIYYTISKSFTYSPDIKLICMEWDVVGSATTLIPGTYSFEIYNKGYAVGNTTLSLK